MEERDRFITQGRSFDDALEVIEACRNRLCCYDTITTVAVVAKKGYLDRLEQTYQGRICDYQSELDFSEDWRYRTIQKIAGWLRFDLEKLSSPLMNEYAQPRPESQQTFRESDHLLVIHKGTAHIEFLLQQLNQMYQKGEVTAFAACMLHPEEQPDVKVHYPPLEVEARAN